MTQLSQLPQPTAATKSDGVYTCKLDMRFLQDYNRDPRKALENVPLVALIRRGRGPMRPEYPRVEGPNEYRGPIKAKAAELKAAGESLRLHLTMAASHNDLSALAALLEVATPSDFESKSGFDPLHSAMASGRAKAAEMLLAAGHPAGADAVLSAAMYVATFDVLLRHAPGADLAARDRYGRGVVEMADGVGVGFDGALRRARSPHDRRAGRYVREVLARRAERA